MTRYLRSNYRMALIAFWIMSLGSGFILFQIGKGVQNGYFESGNFSGWTTNGEVLPVPHFRVAEGKYFVMIGVTFNMFLMQQPEVLKRLVHRICDKSIFEMLRFLRRYRCSVV